MDLVSVFNPEWQKILKPIIDNMEENDGYHYKIGANFSFSVTHPLVISQKLVSMKKLEAMKAWYLEGDKKDTSIVEFFPEYKERIYNGELVSNYGWHMYTNRGLVNCVKRLILNKSSRQAIWFIGDNNNMCSETPDKLCTNSIQYIIENNKLHSIVQMRSSNMLTLLPYDLAMFRFFLMSLKALLYFNYPSLDFGNIHMQIGTLHYYDKDVINLLNK